MSKLNTPRDLLIHELKDLYSAENQLLKAIPRVIKAATSEEFKQALQKHLKQTETQVQRLEKIGKQLDETMKGKKCKAMEGLIEEAKEIMQEEGDPTMLDLAMIGSQQKVEHYEIAGYGTARTLAELAGEDDVAEILQQTLDEEGATDKLLTEIAMQLNVDVGAAAGGERD